MLLIGILDGLRLSHVEQFLRSRVHSPPPRLNTAPSRYLMHLDHLQQAGCMTTFEQWLLPSENRLPSELPQVLAQGSLLLDHSLSDGIWMEVL